MTVDVTGGDMTGGDMTGGVTEGYTGQGASEDAAVRALRELRAGLERTIAELDAASQRADQLLEQRRRGTSWREIVAAEEPPLVVEAISRVLDELGELGSRFRREEALALREEGLSVTQIAEFFRVTRQRASALVQPRPVHRRPGP